MALPKSHPAYPILRKALADYEAASADAFISADATQPGSGTFTRYIRLEAARMIILRVLGVLFGRDELPGEEPPAPRWQWIASSSGARRRRTPTSSCATTCSSAWQVERATSPKSL